MSARKILSQLRSKTASIAVLFFLVSVPVRAGEPIPNLSEEQFRALATRIAPKVNLFAEVWRQDPQAEFYGGTARDYLYWLKGQFKNAKTLEQTQAVVKKLESAPVISIDDILVAESDIDVIGKKRISLNPKHFGVKKVDTKGPEIFDPANPLGKNELDQGYIPAEKIRISKTGILPPTHFGNGVREIYDGKLTVHFTPPEVFSQSHYAKLKLNHPILLAMRFLRLQAVDYFHNYGQGLPIKTKLIDSIDPVSANKVREVINQAANGRELRNYLENSKFAEWMNGSIHKAFRSYSNPTAAMELMKEFGVTTMISRFDGIETLDQYLFARAKDQKKIDQAFREYDVDPKNIFLDVADEFKDGRIYHGTRDNRSFRNILTHGIHPSTSGAAGPGLYGVRKENQAFAESWGGDKNRLVSLEVSPTAKIVDISEEGPGLDLWRRFQKKANRVPTLDDFAETFGIDIICYPYGPRAYVVKNGSVLRNALGVHMQPMTLSMAIDRLDGIHDSKTFHAYTDVIDSNPFTPAEAIYLAEELEKRGKTALLIQSKSVKNLIDDLANSAKPGVLKDTLRDRFLADLLFDKAVLETTNLNHVSALFETVMAPLKNKQNFFIKQEKLSHAFDSFEKMGFLKEITNPNVSADELKRRMSLIGGNNPISIELFKIHGKAFAEMIARRDGVQETFETMKSLLPRKELSDLFREEYFSRLFENASSQLTTLDEASELNRILYKATLISPPMKVPEALQKVAFALWERKGLFLDLSNSTFTPDQQLSRSHLLVGETHLVDQIKSRYGDQISSKLTVFSNVGGEDHFLSKALLSLAETETSTSDSTYRALSLWLLNKPKSTSNMTTQHRLSSLDAEGSGRNAMIRILSEHPDFKNLPKTSQALFKNRLAFGLTSETLSPELMLLDPSVRNEAWEFLSKDQNVRFLQDKSFAAKASEALGPEAVDVFLSRSYESFFKNTDHNSNVLALFSRMAEHPAFIHHPNSADWAEKMLRSYLGYEDAIPRFYGGVGLTHLSEKTLPHLLNAVAKKHPREGAQYFEEILLNRHADRFNSTFTAMLDQEPWSSHPLRSIWKSSLSYNSYKWHEYRNPIPDYSPRKLYYGPRKLLVPFLSARTRKWATAHSASNDLSCADSARNSLLKLIGDQ